MFNMDSVANNVPEYLHFSMTLQRDLSHVPSRCLCQKSLELHDLLGACRTFPIPKGQPNPIPRLSSRRSYVRLLRDVSWKIKLS
jgi:hypothetical protein